METQDREDGRGRCGISDETVGSPGCSVPAGGARNIDDVSAGWCREPLKWVGLVRLESGLEFRGK